MNREILFRGKAITGEWVEGYGVCQYDNEAYIINISPDRTNPREFYSVIPETVGQFTGLIDKAGNKLFEHDIVLGTLKMGRDGEWTSSAYYKVMLSMAYGTSLYVCKLSTEDNANQYPICNAPNFGRGLCTDHRNNLYNSICFDDIWFNGFREQFYSNDIIVAGNIFDTPELIQK